MVCEEDMNGKTRFRSLLMGAMTRKLRMMIWISPQPEEMKYKM
jgi:hypothetical protein